MHGAKGKMQPKKAGRLSTYELVTTIEPGAGGSEPREPGENPPADRKK